MSTIDIVLGILLIFGLVRGIWRGLIIEAASLLAVVLGIYGAIHFSFYAADLLTQNFDWSKQTIKMTAFALTLIVIMLGVMLLGKLLTKVAKMAALGLFNRLFGGVFGLLKYAIISGACLMFLSKTNQTINWIPEAALKSSVLYEPVKAIGTFVYANIFDSKNTDEVKPIEIPNDILPNDKAKDSLENIKGKNQTMPADTLNIFNQNV